MQGKRTLVAIALLVSCALLGPTFAKADTTFDVSGSAIGFGPTCGNCAISGTLMVDTASPGTLNGVDITFQGDPFAFNVLLSSGPGMSDWGLTATNNNNQVLKMFFTTSPTVASLVGLTRGNIESAGSIVRNEVTGLPDYEGLEGSITRAPSAPPPHVPEPCSLALLALGFLACLWFGFARRRTLNG